MNAESVGNYCTGAAFLIAVDIVLQHYSYPVTIHSQLETNDVTLSI